ncbi:MAG TPA: alpha/beta hydrolase [Candidatus Saccharimonadales bacterium]|nr:alpha/beta hydrolase [Candidatus Saccharimonadales bacterium]
MTAALTWQAFTAVADAVSDRITVSIRGHGPDVLLIPGLATSGAVWDAIANHLENHLRLHIIQVAGFAGSPPRANAQGRVVQPTVDAIDAYIKTNKLQTPKVIGHSLGGLMGSMLAFQHPEDVGGLMIVDSLPFFGSLFGMKDTAAAMPQAANMRDNTLAQSQDDYAKSETVFMHSLVKSPDGCKQATKWALASDKSVVARAAYEDMTTDIRPELPKIKIPVTMLYPWDVSSGFPQAATDRLYQENYVDLPNKKIIRIDDSFHFIMLDQPEKFADEVDKFLK